MIDDIIGGDEVGVIDRDWSVYWWLFYIIYISMNLHKEERLNNKIIISI
jgi:hypothetical protein